MLKFVLVLILIAISLCFGLLIASEMQEWDDE
jgi:hypothetical protein